MDIKKETSHNLECIFSFINKSRYRIIHFIGTLFFLKQRGAIYESRYD